MIFRKKPQRKALTGVGTTLSAAHRCQRTGNVHGHTWEITAWFIYDGTDQSVRKHQLTKTLARFEHTCLPDRVAWGEKLAQYVFENIEHGYGVGDPNLVLVECNRPAERIYARWPYGR